MNPRWPVAFAFVALASPMRVQGQVAVVLTPQQTVQAFCDALVDSMKQGPSLGFSGRKQMLEPEIRKALDLPLMTRLVVGPPWKGLKPDEQQQLVEAFSDYSIAVYASRFKEYGGEQFVVAAIVNTLANGNEIVSTKLVIGKGEPVQLDYMMRRGASGWKIIDVFLSGTISELAARRSEYSTVLRSGGAAALIDLLRKKTAQLGV
jgi:phospholipid transport system substrate-binding protein